MQKHTNNDTLESLVASIASRRKVSLPPVKESRHAN